MYKKNKYLLLLVVSLLMVSSVNADSLPVCDLNNDGLRNLIDVSIFASCKDSFDVNNDGLHDLTDVSLYSSNNQNSLWCSNNFICEPIEIIEEEEIKEPVKEKSGSVITIYTLEDGSKFYSFSAHAFQLDKGVLLQWPEGWTGTVNYGNKKIFINDGEGIRIKEKVRK